MTSLESPDTDDPRRDRSRHGDDPRSDLEQEVEARADAVKRGEGRKHPHSPLDDPGSEDGVGGTGGVVRNQDRDAQ